MKRRRIERPERRRALVEMNLLGESKARSIVARRGCAAMLGRLLGGVLVVLVLGSGLG